MKKRTVVYDIEIVRSADGFSAGVPSISACWAIGPTRDAALQKCQALALHTLAARMETALSPSGRVIGATFRIIKDVADARSPKGNHSVEVFERLRSVFKAARTGRMVASTSYMADLLPALEESHWAVEQLLRLPRPGSEYPPGVARLAPRYALRLAAVVGAAAERAAIVAFVHKREGSTLANQIMGGMHAR